MAAAIAAAERATTLADFITGVRAAVAPFDQRTGHVSDDAPLSNPTVANDLGKPSRLASIEELPVAVAALVFGAGDFAKTMRAGVFYGRDCDSIAGMACGLFGALHGVEALPAALRTASDKANRRNFAVLATDFAPVVTRVLAADEQRLSRRRSAVAVT
jgi:hypothetical protein